MDFRAHHGRRSVLRTARRVVVWTLVVCLAGLQGYLGTWPPVTRVTNDAMAPTLEPGQFVALKRVDGRVGHGDVIMAPVPLAIQREQAYPSEILRRVVDVTPEGQLVLRGDNRTDDEPFLTAPSSVRERLFAVVPVVDAVAAELSRFQDAAEPTLERIETAARPVGEVIEPWSDRVPLFPISGIVLVVLLLMALRILRERRRRSDFRAPRVDLLHPKLEWTPQRGQAHVRRPISTTDHARDDTQEIPDRPRPPVFPRPILTEDDLPLIPALVEDEPEHEPVRGRSGTTEPALSDADFLAALQDRLAEILDQELDEHTRELAVEVESHLQRAASENASVRDTVGQLVGAVGEYGEHLRSHTAILQSMSAASADLASVVTALKGILERPVSDGGDGPDATHAPGSRTDPASEQREDGPQHEARHVARPGLTIRVHDLDVVTRPKATPLAPPAGRAATTGRLRIRIHELPRAERSEQAEPPAAPTIVPPEEAPASGYRVEARGDAATPARRRSPADRTLIAGRLIEWLHVVAHERRAVVRIDELAVHLGVETEAAEALLAWLAIRGELELAAVRVGDLYVCEL